MLKMRNTGKIIAAVLTLILLLQPKLSFADWGGRHGDHHDFHGSYHYYDHPRFGFHVSILPEGCFSVVVGGARYYYYDGLYYRRFDGDYVIVEPPMGAIVTTVPSAFQPVIVNGVTYYANNGTYYVYTPNGYQVVPPPVTVVQPAPVVVNQPAAEVPAQPAAPAAASQPVPAIPPQAAPAAVGKDEPFVVNIPNEKGGYTAVTVKKSGKGFVGPQGEFYSEFPKVSQLKAMYGK